MLLYAIIFVFITHPCITSICMFFLAHISYLCFQHSEHRKICSLFQFSFLRYNLLF